MKTILYLIKLWSPISKLLNTIIDAKDDGTIDPEETVLICNETADLLANCVEAVRLAKKERENVNTQPKETINV